VLDYIVIRRRQVKGWFLELKDILRGVDWAAKCFETYLGQSYSWERAVWLVSYCPAPWRWPADDIWLRMAYA